MENKVLDGFLFAKLLRGGAAALQANKQMINDLNVFPIPDGDTGDNMSLTINAGASAVGEGSESLSQIAGKAASGMLLGARGNSGVILSRIFAGLAKGFEGIQEADVKGLAAAFESGVSEAYGAVSVPVEGTILTVLKDSVAYANGRVGNESDFDSYFADFHRELRLSLERTPDLLDVLREAGVVDSGGAGLGVIVEGMRSALSGAEAVLAAEAPTQAQQVDLDAFTENSVLEFGYCTEFLLRLQKSKVDLDSFDEGVLIDYLNSVGDSVVCFREGSIVKVHVHTKTPGDILNEMQRYGEFLTFKMENMTLQHNENHMAEKFAPKPRMPHKPFGVVSVAAGEGIKDAFVSLGCDAVVDGGQSMNPSAEDLIDAFKRVNADVIFVFPNNSNIIMTAKQAAQLYKDAEVRVVPTKTIGEGYAAISMLDTSAGDCDAIIEELEGIIADVVTGMVSRAVRDTEMGGVQVHKDDYIGFVGDTIYTADATRNEAAEALCAATKAGRYDIMLLVCGADAGSDEAQALCNSLQKQYRRTEVIMIDGGQPIYDYIIILE